MSVQYLHADSLLSFLMISLKHDGYVSYMYIQGCVNQDWERCGTAFNFELCLLFSSNVYKYSPCTAVHIWSLSNQLWGAPLKSFLGMCVPGCEVLLWSHFQVCVYPVVKCFLEVIVGCVFTQLLNAPLKSFSGICVPSCESLLWNHFRLSVVCVPIETRRKNFGETTTEEG